MAPCMTDSLWEAELRCGLHRLYVAYLPFHANLTRNCASALAEAMKAPACPVNFKPNSTSTPSGASAKSRNLLATATAAGLIASSAASKVAPTVAITSLGCNPRVPPPSSTSIRTSPPASSGKMRRFTSKHLVVQAVNYTSFLTPSQSQDPAPDPPENEYPRVFQIRVWGGSHQLFLRSTIPP